MELAISMFVLALVCISWFKILGLQSARKEARRREAVERLAGMMDAFLYCHGRDFPATGSYRMEMDGATVSFPKDGTDGEVHPLFDGDVSPIGYRLCIVEKEDLPEADRFEGWYYTVGRRQYERWWLVGRLYENNGALKDAGKVLFTLPVCTGMDEG